MKIDNSFLLRKGDSSLIRYAGAKRILLGMTRCFSFGKRGKNGGWTASILHSSHTLKLLTKRHFDGVLPS